MKHQHKELLLIVKYLESDSFLWQKYVLCYFPYSIMSRLLECK